MVQVLVIELHLKKLNTDGNVKIIYLGSSISENLST